MWDDGFVEDDFLAPPGCSPADDSDTNAEDLDADDDDWDPDQGFPDSLRTVRVWADADGVLENVRVSLNWRAALKSSDLDTAFHEAFMALNVYRTAGKYVLPSPEPLPAQAWDGGVGWHTLRRMEQEWAEVDQLIAELPDEPPTRWVGTACTGSSHGGGITVELGLFGEPVGAYFDPEWVEGPARSSTISHGVLSAYRRARAKYKPPRVEFSQRDLLARHYNRITQSVLKSFGNGLAL